MHRTPVAKSLKPRRFIVPYRRRALVVAMPSTRAARLLAHQPVITEHVIARLVAGNCGIGSASTAFLSAVSSSCTSKGLTANEVASCCCATTGCVCDETLTTDVPSDCLVRLPVLYGKHGKRGTPDLCSFRGDCCLCMTVRYLN
jgi:hypothetical protein